MSASNMKDNRILCFTFFNCQLILRSLQKLTCGTNIPMGRATYLILKFCKKKLRHSTFHSSFKCKMIQFKWRSRIKKIVKVSVFVKNRRKLKSREIDTAISSLQNQMIKHLRFPSSYRFWADFDRI